MEISLSPDTLKELHRFADSIFWALIFVAAAVFFSD